MAKVTQVGRVTARSLRADWSERSLTESWAFPSDWDSPAVDAVCEAIAAEDDVFPAAERLGRVRAGAGVALGEALADIDQLIGLVPGQQADVLRRAVSLGWADRAIAPASEISDPLTGLVSKEYLQVRLAEVYQGCQAAGTDVAHEYALAVVRLDLTGRNDWQRALPMILAGECMRVIFDAGETLARLGDPMAVVLTARTPMLSRRVQMLGRLIAGRTRADPDSQINPPRVWIEPLPAQYSAAQALLAELGR